MSNRNSPVVNNEELEIASGRVQLTASSIIVGLIYFSLTDLHQDSLITWVVDTRIFFIFYSFGLSIILLLNYLDFHFKRMCFFSMVVAINVWCGSAFELELVDGSFYWGGVVSTCFDTHRFNHLSFLSIIGRQTLSLNSLLATKYFMYCRNFFAFHLGQPQVPYVISLSRNFIKCIHCI